MPHARPREPNTFERDDTAPVLSGSDSADGEQSAPVPDWFGRYRVQR